jgi:hypothetical protein
MPPAAAGDIRKPSWRAAREVRTGLYGVSGGARWLFGNLADGVEPFIIYRFERHLSIEGKS